jgi:glycosyltransferase involved in cell wall biosynthesis
VLAVAAMADAVIAVSRYTRDCVISELRVPSDRVTTVYNGIAPGSGWDVPALAPEVDDTQHAARPYVLHVGGCAPRKNVPVAVKAVAALRDRLSWPGRLVIVNGRDGTGGVDGGILAAAGGTLPEWLSVLGQVPERELWALYKGADALLYPSREEGFGLPPLEAMAAGTPAVVAASAALPEVCGPAALYATWDHPDEFTAQLARLQQDRGLRERMIRRGLRWAGRFTNLRMAGGVLAVYRRALCA